MIFKWFFLIIFFGQWKWTHLFILKYVELIKLFDQVFICMTSIQKRIILSWLVKNAFHMNHNKLGFFVIAKNLKISVKYFNHAPVGQKKLKKIRNFFANMKLVYSNWLIKVQWVIYIFLLLSLYNWKFSNDSCKPSKLEEDEE